MTAYSRLGRVPALGEQHVVEGGDLGVGADLVTEAPGRPEGQTG